jgi:hypothetical protein
LFVGRWSPSAPPNPQNKTDCAISDFSATLLAKMHSDKLDSDLRGPVVTAKILIVTQDV